MNPKVNWQHWDHLALWPLDAACKIACGENPDAPTFWSHILCDGLYRTEWVDLMQEAAFDIEQGDLQVTEDTWTVNPDQFEAWIKLNHPDLFDNLLKRE